MPKKTAPALNRIRLTVAPVEMESQVDDEKYTMFAPGLFVDGQHLAGEGDNESAPALDAMHLWETLRFDFDAWPLTCSCGVPECARIEDPVKSRRQNGVVTWTFPASYFERLAKSGLVTGFPREITLRFDASEFYAEVTQAVATIRQFEEESGKHSGFALGTWRAPEWGIWQQLEAAYDWRMERLKPRRFARHKGMPLGACAAGVHALSIRDFTHCPCCGASGTINFYESPETEVLAGKPVTAIAKWYFCRRCNEGFFPRDEEGDWLNNTYNEYQRLYGTARADLTGTDASAESGNPVG